jgi:hypothetical protein
MKEKIDTQINLFEFYAEHEMGQQLKSISKFLDDHCAIVDLAAQYLVKIEQFHAAKFH